jgi:amino acid permease
MFSVINELAAPSTQKFVKIISISSVSSGIFYVIVGLAGYLSYGDNVGGNIIMMCKYLPASAP